MIDQTNTPSTSSPENAPENTDANRSDTPATGSAPSSWNSSTTPVTPTAVSEPAITPPKPPTPSNEHKKSPVMRIVLLLLVLVLIAAAGALGYKMSKSKADKDTTALKSQITALQSNSHELPAGAVKVSDCIPNMGSHYLPTGSDPEYGPFVLVTKAGKVIGLEYMAAPSMYTAIPNTDPPVQLITKDSPLFGWKFDHIEFSHLPKGHEGFMVDHIDVHLFTVPSSEVKQACV